MALLDQWDDHRPTSDGHEREMPMTLQCVGDETLTPHPGQGWVAMLSYDSTVPVHPLDIGCWLIAVSQAQEHTLSAGRQMHAIARDADGERILLVHPCLHRWAELLVDELDDHRAGIASRCGGWSTLAPEWQVKACRTFVRRVWPTVPLSVQVRTLTEHGLEPACLMEPDGRWLDQVPDAGSLHRLVEASQPGCSWLLEP